MKKTNYSRFAALNCLSRKGDLPFSSFKAFKTMKKDMMQVEEAMLQGTCGGQLTLAEAQEHHRLCRCPAQVPEPMEEDPYEDTPHMDQNPFDGLPTLVEGLCMEENSDMLEGDDLNLEFHPFWNDPMAALIKASVGPTLPDLAELFKGFTLPTSGAITKQRRAKSSEKACAVSA